MLFFVNMIGRIFFTTNVPVHLHKNKNHEHERLTWFSRTIW